MCGLGEIRWVLKKSGWQPRRGLPNTNPWTAAAQQIAGAAAQAGEEGQDTEEEGKEEGGREEVEMAAGG
jgi:hypothetical protein